MKTSYIKKIVVCTFSLLVLKGGVGLKTKPMKAAVNAERDELAEVARNKGMNLTQYLKDCGVQITEMQAI